MDSFTKMLQQVRIDKGRGKEGFFRILIVIFVAVLLVGLFLLLRTIFSPGASLPREGIFFWEDGKEHLLPDEDSSLYNLLAQTLHRLNQQKVCNVSEERLGRIKEANKLVELIPKDPEDIKINQWIEPNKRTYIPTDKDGYRVLKGVDSTIFILEDKLDEGLQAIILISTEEEGEWSCWAIKQGKGDELDKSWIGEINKILTQEQVAAPPEPEIFLITKVVDGDTVEIETGQKVHYLGINAPEIGKCFGKRAKTKNKELVVGKEARFYKDIAADKAGRLLRYVWIEDVFVNDFLVRQGYAVANPQSPNTRYEEQLHQAEEEAKEKKRGLWQTCKPKPAIPPVKTTGNVVINIACSQFNPTGNDNFNKKEEYVCFTNKDSVTINMEGWAVEDGWYGWVYTFPRFTLSPGKSVRVRTGCGSDSFTNLYWCKMGYEVWHNEGDTIFLRDSSRTIVDAYTYTYLEAQEPED